jgi:hypothetical protein
LNRLALEFLSFKCLQTVARKPFNGL